VTKRPVRILRVPKGYKDAGEWLKAERPPAALVAAIEAAETVKPSVNDNEPPFSRGLREDFAGSGESAEEASGESKESPRVFRGPSILELSEREINDEDTLLGRRYLCRGGGMFVVAPSGQGKSSLSVQMAVLWSCGRAAFGIHPTRPLQVLILQAEDDQGDCIEMSQMVAHLDLADAQKQLVRENTALVHVNDLTGKAFIDAIDSTLSVRRYDIVMINPYTAFTGGDVKEPKLNTNFLRNWLTPVLSKHGAAAVVMHHTPKTSFQNTDQFQETDWQYGGPVTLESRTGHAHTLWLSRWLTECSASSLRNAAAGLGGNRSTSISNTHPYLASSGGRRPRPWMSRRQKHLTRREGNWTSTKSWSLCRSSSPKIKRRSSPAWRRVFM
jgi:hypothetical protein